MEPTVFLVALLVVALAGAFAAGSWFWRRRAIAARAEQDARTVAWEALVLARTDLHLAVDEHGNATLHGMAGGVRYAIRCVRVEGERPHLKVTARRLEREHAQLWIAPHNADGAPPNPDERTHYSHRVATGDEAFDARLMVFSDRHGEVTARLTPEVRASLGLFPDPWIVLDLDRLTMGLSYLAESDLDEARVDALKVVVAGLCAPAGSSPGAVLD